MERGDKVNTSSIRGRETKMKIRIQNKDGSSKSTSIFMVDEETGKEHDISNIITHYHLEQTGDDRNSIEVQMVGANSEVDTELLAEIDSETLRDLKRLIENECGRRFFNQEIDEGGEDE